MNWYIKVLKNYAVFSGRARRKEYWWFTLFNFIFTLVPLVIYEIIRIAFITHGLGVTIYYGTLVMAVIFIYGLAVFIPSLAVLVRRLHDTNRSGWWYFISAVPIVGGIILLIFLVMDSSPGENRYAPNPKTEVATGQVQLD